MSGPLAQLRVLDLSRVLAGPWATQYLADMGAEVIKIERPGTGDDTRQWGPPWAQPPSDGDPGLSAYTLATNRGKRSLALDLTTSEGQHLLRQLARRADVLVENFKVGALARYGLDAASLTALNPRLIYCSITGFGQSGPYAQRAGYDFLIQAMGGLMSITGAPDADGGEPMKVGVAISDLLTGLYATTAILTALAQRERTGKGEVIDMALLDCTVAALANQATNFLVSGRTPERLGNAHPNVVPYQVFRTADGFMILAIGNDGQFRRFCRAAGCDELAGDPRFRTNAGRVEHRAELIEALERRIERDTTVAWMELLEPVGVPCGPINDLAAVFADPQVQARGLERRLDHP
ncbi:MAG: CaiB/BaiF CoA transferase family protein, partial [Pseudomonadota bacterium]